MSTARAALGAFLASLLIAGYVTAHPFVSSDSTPQSIDSDWKARAAAWFKSTDEADRRKQMREVTQALRQPCRYCHTPDFTGYTDKHLISLQMMALSAEHNVTCADCHAGKDTLTEMGRLAQPMWALSAERKTFCGECHVKHKRFSSITQKGEIFAKGEWPSWKAAYDAKVKAKAAANPEKAP